MNKESAEELLINGLKILDLPYTESQINQFLIYLSELKKWNKACNLTGLKTDRDIIVKNFLDSLLFSKVLPAEKLIIADVGSGAGFPGIPMKMMNPDLKMYLIEPNQKKAVFLRHACSILKLDNVEIINKRIEDIEGLSVDVAVTRALYSISEFMERTRHIIRENSILILSKGPRLQDELKKIPQKKITIKNFTLPYQNIIRHLVIVYM